MIAEGKPSIEEHSQQLNPDVGSTPVVHDYVIGKVHSNKIRALPSNRASPSRATQVNVSENAPLVSVRNSGCADGYGTGCAYNDSTKCVTAHDGEATA
ncbi:hypothetical protein MRX96_031333 [Rhipicephalus microplus]